jgi:murein L,D-transpeptidase YafK
MIIKTLLLFYLGMAQPGDSASFLQYQQAFDRVSEAFEAKDDSLRQAFEERGLIYPPKQIFIRAFKHDMELELWVRNSASDTFQLFRTYKVCMNSGEMGPKRKQGDKQIPEGFYTIEIFNPWSNYHLSMGINYPNRSDSILSPYSDKGGDIYIHGGCATIGCLPMTDEKIKEIYILSVYAKHAGQEELPVHIFPTRMEKIGMAQFIFGENHDEELMDFWKNLRMGYTYFEVTRRLPKIEVDEKGSYVFYETADELEE